MFKKLFGGQKKDYFLELKEEDNQGATATPEPVAEPVAEAAPQAVEAAPAEAAPAEAAPVKTSKKTSIKSKKAAQAPKAEPAPAPVAVATVKKEEPKEVNFATEYLITPTLSRRLPGPSLNPFKEMARQIKRR